MDDTLDLEAEMDETISEVRKRNYVFSKYHQHRCGSFEVFLVRSEAPERETFFSMEY